MLYSMLLQSENEGTGPGIFGSLIGLLVAVLLIAAMWKVFSKAGQPGWAAIIPIYNILVLLRVVGRPWWWLLLMFIPFVNLVIGIVVYYDLAKSFGHGVLFLLGLLFLPFIFLVILGFGGDKYLGPAAGPNRAAVPA
jgi:hypothetical protein